MNSWLIAITAVIAVFLLAAVLRKARSSGPSGADNNWPLYKRKPLTEPEQVLYYRLAKALPECIVLAQVQLSRLVGVKKGVNHTAWNNRLSQKSVDFVICLRDMTVVAAVELDDSTHKRPSRRAADATKNKALESAGITMLRWNVSAMPNEEEIRLTFTAEDSGRSTGASALPHLA